MTLERLRSGYHDDPFATTSFLTVEGFRFYIPAFLRILVCHPEYHGWFEDVAFYALSPPRGESPDDYGQWPVMQQHWQDRLDSLSESQKQAISATLLYLFEREPSRFERDTQFQRALWYWSDESPPECG